MICSLCRDLVDQRVSESDDVFFRDLTDGLIRPLAQKVQKALGALSQTEGRKSGLIRPSQNQPHPSPTKRFSLSTLLLFVLRDPRFDYFLNQCGWQRLIHGEADGPFGCRVAFKFILERFDS